jgi:hypothetical protein
MRRPSASVRLTLPQKLVFSALPVAMAGLLACDGATGSAADAAAEAVAHAESGTADAPADATSDRADPSVTDATADTLSDGSGDELSEASPTDGQSEACAILCGGESDACPAYVCDPDECPIDAGCGGFG